MRPIRVRRLSVFILSSKEPFKFCPGRQFRICSFFEPGAAGLIDAAPDHGSSPVLWESVEMAIMTPDAAAGRDIFRKLTFRAVGAGTDLEKTPVLARVCRRPCRRRSRTRGV